MLTLMRNNGRLNLFFWEKSSSYCCWSWSIGYNTIISCAQCRYQHNGFFVLIKYNDMTPFDRAASKGHLKIIEYLVDNGADLSLMNQNIPLIYIIGPLFILHLVMVSLIWLNSWFLLTLILMPKSQKY